VKGWTPDKALRKNSQKPAEAPEPMKRAIAAKQKATGQKRKRSEPKVNKVYEMITAELDSGDNGPCNTVSVDGRIVYCIDD